jgi:hypothetical protein
MISETDRWVKLASKAWPFRKTLEEFLELHHQECSCQTMLLAQGYENVALTIPKEVISLAKKREKSGKSVEFKPVAQQKVNAHDYTQRLRVLFMWIDEDLEHVNVAGKGSVDIKHIVRIQFFYKHFLR